MSRWSWLGLCILAACSSTDELAIRGATQALSADTVDPPLDMQLVAAGSAAPPSTSKTAAIDAPLESLPVYELIQQNATATLVAKGDDGTLIVDASDGKLLFDRPEKARSFATPEEFVAFAQERLGAKPVFDKSGQLRGLTGSLQQFGIPVVVDANAKSVSAVEDPIAAILGGTQGFVVVANKELCLTESCAQEKGQVFETAIEPLSSQTQCQGSLCISGGTYKNQWFNYHRAGAWTDVSGVTILCSWFGWFCPTPADELSASATYIKRDGSRWGYHEDRRPASHVEVSRWAIDWWIFGRSGDGDLIDTVGVCGRHSGRRGNDRVSFTTSEGDTRGGCY